MTAEPKASSTPKLVDIRSRRRIGNSNKDILQSPINFDNDADSYEDEKSNSDFDDETDEVSAEQLTNTKFCNCIPPFATMVSMVIFMLLFTLYWQGETSGEKEKKTFRLEDLKEEFPSQAEDFWLSVELNIKEILKSNRPKTFLFLYDKNSQKTTDDIVYKIGKYAVCKLTNCSSVPVNYEGYKFNTTDILNDYGKIISAVKDKVEESGVMIVKHLDQVPGQSAQAFHSLCDEYNPLVNKALFIFTMKVDRFDKDNVRNVENYLRKIWSDLNDDLFYPLFTRISYNILPIKAEN